MAKRKLGNETRVMLAWLKAHLKAAERDARARARAQDYGRAQLAIGRAEAYSYAATYLTTSLYAKRLEDPEPRR